MRIKCAPVILLFLLSACAGLQQSEEGGGPAPAASKGEGLLRQQIVNAQEQSARLEVRLSKFEKKITTLGNVIRGLETNQTRLEETIARFRRGTEGMAPPRARARRRAPARKANKTSRERRTSRSSYPAGPVSSISPKAPAGLETASGARSASIKPLDDYRRAYRSVRDKKNNQAILQFQNFLRRYPGNRLAANAQYWLGESYYDLRKFSTSLIEFQKVINRYPSSRKVPDALYKKGLTYLRTENPQKAALEFEKLIKKFPDHRLTPRARLKLQSLNNAGYISRR